MQLFGSKARMVGRRREACLDIGRPLRAHRAVGAAGAREEPKIHEGSSGKWHSAALMSFASSIAGTGGSRLGVAPASPPKARGNPVLVPEQPVDGERDQRVGNVLVGVPIIGSGVMDAQARIVGVPIPPVRVLCTLAGTPWVGADRRIQYNDAFARVAETERIEIGVRDIGDPDLVLLKDGGEVTLPHPHEAEVADQLEIRIILPDSTVLFSDGQGQFGDLRSRYDREWTGRWPVRPGCPARQWRPPWECGRSCRRTGHRVAGG